MVSTLTIGFLSQDLRLWSRARVPAMACWDPPAHRTMNLLSLGSYVTGRSSWGTRPPGERAGPWVLSRKVENGP